MKNGLQNSKLNVHFGSEQNFLFYRNFQLQLHFNKKAGKEYLQL